jgi:hypothetical protein
VREVREVIESCARYMERKKTGRYAPARDSKEEREASEKKEIVYTYNKRICDDGDSGRRKYWSRNMCVT